MKHATLADAPAALNTNDKAMWVLGFNAAVEAATADLKQWEKARFGFFHPDGRFEELPPYSGWEDHPQAHSARWVGGSHDAQLLRAALAHGAGGPISTDRKRIGRLRAALFAIEHSLVDAELRQAAQDALEDDDEHADGVLASGNQTFSRSDADGG